MSTELYDGPGVLVSRFAGPESMREVYGHRRMVAVTYLPTRSRCEMPEHLFTMMLAGLTDVPATDVQVKLSAISDATGPRR